MNKEEWIRYNNKIINTNSSAKGGISLNQAVHAYLSSRSKEIHSTILNDFNSPKGFSHLINALCSDLATTESLLLGNSAVLEHADSEDLQEIRNNAHDLTKAIHFYFGNRLKNSKSLKRYLKDIGRNGNTTD